MWPAHDQARVLQRVHHRGHVPRADPELVAEVAHDRRAVAVQRLQQPQPGVTAGRPRPGPRSSAGTRTANRAVSGDQGTGRSASGRPVRGTRGRAPPASGFRLRHRQQLGRSAPRVRCAPLCLVQKLLRYLILARATRGDSLTRLLRWVLYPSDFHRVSNFAPARLEEEPSHDRSRRARKPQAYQRRTRRAACWPAQPVDAWTRPGHR